MSSSLNLPVSRAFGTLRNGGKNWKPPNGLSGLAAGTFWLALAKAVAPATIAGNAAAPAGPAGEVPEAKAAISLCDAPRPRLSAVPTCWAIAPPRSNVLRKGA